MRPSCIKKRTGTDLAETGQTGQNAGMKKTDHAECHDTGWMNSENRTQKQVRSFCCQQLQNKKSLSHRYRFLPEALVHYGRSSDFPGFADLPDPPGADQWHFLQIFIGGSSADTGLQQRVLFRIYTGFPFKPVGRSQPAPQGFIHSRHEKRTKKRANRLFRRVPPFSQTFSIPFSISQPLCL